jgi:hypothetical protein
MKKIIFGTASIIRGDFHKFTIGKFYKIYNELLKNFEVIHIINIDQPENLKNYFTVYETVYEFNKIIPDFVNKIYITPNIPSFACAFKNIINKADELIDEDSLFWWLEDDWEPKNNYNFIEIIKDYWKLQNCCFTFSTNAPFGSFRGGPLINYSYFKNYFSSNKKITDTCDPEKEMSQYMRNLNIEVQVIGILKDRNLFNLHLYFYKRKQINHEVFIINDGKIFEYKNNTFTEVSYDCISNNSKIKYFAISPHLFNDENFGRKFLDKYLLNKWITKEHNSTYINPSFLNSFLGNYYNLKTNIIRLEPKYTCNKNFFSSLTDILQCLPYIDKNYKEKINIKYYSHNYGNYPNFEVFTDLIKLNYIPTITESVSEELYCLEKLSKKICGNQYNDYNMNDLYSYKYNFKLANNYFNKFFIFNNNILDKINKFTESFSNILGIHFKDTNKNKLDKIAEVSSENFIKIIQNDIMENNYDKIFVIYNKINFLEDLKKNINIPIIFYDEIKIYNSINKKRLEIIKNLIDKIEKADFNEKIILENELKNEAQINKYILENLIINCMILSRCKKVIKTNSNFSAYAKVFNPELEIYRVNGNSTNMWPDSYIPLYPKNINNTNINNILNKIQENENKNKDLYKEFL